MIWINILIVLSAIILVTLFYLLFVVLPYNLGKYYERRKYNKSKNSNE